MLLPNTYFGYHLTGEIAVDHSSASNIGGVYDLNNMTWTESMMEKLGISLSMMPERLIASTDKTGDQTESAAAKLGLAAGTPLIAGGIDAAVATLSAGIFNPGNHLVMIGTSMCWGFITEEDPW